ncbi:MAG: NAD(+) synthase, partial [Pseudomonadota bacterium]
MSDTLRMTLAQLNPTVGDFAANAAKAREAHRAGREAGSRIVILPEMFLTGYQTSDLGRKPAFVSEAYRWVERLAADCADGPALGIGAPLRDGEALYNAYFILDRGAVHTVVRKQILPNDAVFDEVRVYDAGPPAGPFVLDGIRIGTPICEDAWHPGPTETFEESGAEILVVPNGSPYHRDKQDLRMTLMVSRVVESGLPLVYLNTIGGQDDQVFDGGSFVLNAGGGLAMSMPVFEEALEHVTFERQNGQLVCQGGPKADWPDAWEQDYAAMVGGLRDYLGKSGFSKVLLGLSGGVDSALVAVIASDALGPENVRCVMLPSEYTSAHSLEDAEAVARALGCPYQSVPISGPRAAVTEALAPAFTGRDADVTEENIQSRLRGLILMAMSNKF